METKSKIVNRAATARPAAAPLVQRAAPVLGGTAVRVQTALRVSSPADPAEREAESTAKRIMRMALPGRLEPRAAPRAPISRWPGPEVQRKAEGLPDVSANVAAEIQASDAAGQPLPASVRRFMEPRFRADFGGVRIHTSDRAATLNRQLAARAFTVGRQVFFGRDQFRPENEEGKELIAHELTHTIQQGSVAQRSEDPGVRQQAPVQVQRLGISDALDYFADKAYNIPGYRMFTILLGVNPINMSRVERSAANILRAIVEFLPGGHLIVEALENYGVFEKIGHWVDDQLTSLGITGGAIRKAINDFLDSLSWRDIFHLGRVWDRAKRIFTDPIDRIITFVKNLAVAILRFIKDAILRPLAGLAAKTRGYDLIKAILRQDPITGEPYPRNADTLIGGFMKLIGQEEVWENIKKANAIARAWAWFQGALSGLMAFVTAIPRQFIATLQSLTIGDIVVLPKAFAKVAGFFVDTAVRFGSWALEQVLSLLQIIFEVLAPGAMVYLRKAQAAFKTIVRNPIGFIRNLVRAGIQGFRQFGTNFLTHLKNALIQWITGTMAGANIYLPKAFTIPEIIKFVLSVLGLTWQNIRAKLVKVIGEPAMAALETGFDIVVTLVREGPAAAWEKIQEAIGNLRDMVMDQVMTFVRDKVVTAAVTKLLSSLNPAGAFIQAVIAIYNTVMFFVERLKQIAQVAMTVIDAIAAIAAGVIVPAANKVEQTMGGLLTLVISFLARLVGLGNVSEAVSNVINRVRAPIDRGLDRVVEWIVAQARRLGRFIAQAGVPQDPIERLRLASEASLAVARRLPSGISAVGLKGALAFLRTRYGLTALETFQEAGQWAVRAAINPTRTWRLPLAGETAGTGGVVAVSESPVSPAGVRNVALRGELLPRLVRATAPNYNALMPAISSLASPHRHFVQGYEWAHAWGPGFGDEARAGLMLASGEVNRYLQSHGRVYGIEGYLRRLSDGVRGRGGRVLLEVTAISYADPPPGVPGPIGAPVLRRVEYVVGVIEADGREHRATATILVGQPRPNGAGGQGTPLFGSLESVIRAIHYV